MNLLQVLVSFGVLSMVGLLLLHKHFLSVTPDHHASAAAQDLRANMHNIHSLLELIKVQNETIHTLEGHLKMKMISEEGLALKEDKRLIEISDTISKLTRENDAYRIKAETCFNESDLSQRKVDRCTQTASVQVVPPAFSTSSASTHYHHHTTSMEDDCEVRYGMELANIWRENEQTWCKTRVGLSSEKGSELKCYPYHQKHKKSDGRGPDLFCVASNFIIDFNKIGGQIVSKGKPPRGAGYLSFGQNSLTSSCERTSHYNARMFMPHHALQMRTFQSSVGVGSSSGGSGLVDDDHQVVDTTTYLLARDEDCENSFHSTADFMNMFLVHSILGTDLNTQQVMLFDKYSDGAYLELIQKAFSPKFPVLRHTHYKGKVMFKKLIFHLESPAGLIFPKVSRPDPMRCYRASLFDAYRRHILQSFQLLDVAPPAIPSITLSLRHRTPQKNVGRVMANEKEVISILKKGNLVNLNVVDTGKMSYGDQLKLIRSTNVLVGIHGAGLMLIMFAAEEAVLVEIHPSYRQDRHFRHAARMTGKIYMPVRSLHRESCVGSSDSVTVPLEEFSRTMDGAVRIARNFDDGLSECGLVCPTEILALDSRLNSHYKSGEKRGRAVNTRFPCG